MHRYLSPDRKSYTEISDLIEKDSVPPIVPSRIEEKNMPTDRFSKKDLELILEVNKKSVEINNAVASQIEEFNEKISEQNESLESIREDQKKGFSAINDSLKEIKEKADKASKSLDDISKEIYKMQVLFITGLLSIIIQVIQLFIKK